MKLARLLIYKYYHVVKILAIFKKKPIFTKMIFLLIITLGFLQMHQAFQLEGNFRFRKDTERIIFSRQCQQQSLNCRQEMIYLKSYINHQDFYIDTGKNYFLTTKIMLKLL